MRPPPGLACDRCLFRIEATEIHLVLTDPDQEEPLQMPFLLVMPSKDVVACPHRWEQRRNVEHQSGLLSVLADQSLLIGLAGLDSSAGRVHPRTTPGQVGAKEQQSTGAVDDQRTHCLANRWHVATAG